MALYLGLDAGTQGTKALVLDAEAERVVARASSGYDLIEGLPPGHAEQHPETWITAVLDVVGQLGAAIDLSRVRAVGVSGQQHGFVPLDARRRVIRPAKLWCDTATAPEARELSEAFGFRVPAGFTASKILWLKRHEPESFAKLRWFALPHDWLNLVLTDELVMEAGDASGTALFDVERRVFDEGRLRTIDPALARMVPPLIAPGDPAGRLSAAAAQRFGLPEGIPVAAGGGDNMMSAIGAGATEPGIVVLSLGTSGTVFTYSASPVIDPGGLIAPFCDSTGGWLPLLCVMNLTGVTEEVRGAFGLDHAAITALAADVDPGCGGLLLLPFLQGERVPDLPEATGTLTGIRHGWLQPGVLYRAALEGTTFNLAWGADRMRALGVEVAALRLVGGAAQNPLWQRIIAGVFGCPVRVMAETESAALGAALQALWTERRAAGEARSITETVAPFLSPGDPIEPDAGTRAVYEESMRSYRDAVDRESFRGT